MSTSVERDDSAALSAGPLHLAFRFDGTRWAHTLCVSDTLVASSLEWESGRDDLERMISPPYQQLAMNANGPNPNAMLLGQWGKHHGSGTFVVTETFPGAVIDVDVAVRTQAALTAMACTYCVNLTSSALIQADDRAIVWSLPDGPRGVLSFEAGSDAAHVIVAEAGRAGTTVQVTGPANGGTATRRLQYRWRWEPSTNAPHGT